MIPTADYYTVDGFRIDQNGVKPDIEVNQSEALEYVLNSLIQQ
jgi:C-terminal processing protease CtpA/Prc